MFKFSMKGRWDILVFTKYNAHYYYIYDLLFFVISGTFDLRPIVKIKLMKYWLKQIILTDHTLFRSWMKAPSRTTIWIESHTTHIRAVITHKKVGNIINNNNGGFIWRLALQHYCPGHNIAAMEELNLT